VSVLVPMSPEAYAQYVVVAVAGYAQQNIASGRWPAEGALERSGAEHQKLLPQGLATPDNYLFEIQDAEAGTVVGSLWFAVENRGGARTGFVFDVRVDERYRRQGHATRAFTALEPFVRGLGLSTIGLHVFAYNVEAQALYEALGYRVTSLNMHKHLGNEPAA